MTEINFERLDAAITYAVENPERFDMMHWFRRNGCGTTACLAGTAAMLAGWEPVFDSGWFFASDVECDGAIADVQDVAADLLGLDSHQCNIFGAADLDEVIKVRNEWAREAGVPERSWGAS